MSWGEGSVFLRGSTYWIQYYRQGQRVRESSHSRNEQTARDLLAQRQKTQTVTSHFCPQCGTSTIVVKRSA